MRFRIELKGDDIDSRQLWEKIKVYAVNLTEVDGVIWVHGETNARNLGFIIDRCAAFGNLDIKVYN